MPSPVRGLHPGAGVKGRPHPVGSVPVGTPTSPKSRPDPRPCLSRGSPALPPALLAGRSRLGRDEPELLKVGDPEAGWRLVFCRRCHGCATLRARDALRPGPGAVRAAASGPRGHRVAGGGPGTRDPGAGECPGGPGAPGVTLYCKFLQIQR